MNTLELLHDLSKFVCVGNKGGYGVYASDQLPKEKIVRPSLIIANTAPSSHSGKHWCGFYFKSGSNKAEFFDSFGGAPRKREFLRFIKNNSTSYIYNHKRLQSNWSTCCGNYAILFLFFRCSNLSMSTFLKEFDVKNPETNDIKVMNMYAKMSENLHRKMRCKKYKNQTGGNCNVITCNQTCAPLQRRHRKIQLRHSSMEYKPC